MFLNKKIKEARIENKLTQQQLADELTKLNRKTSNTAIANWESGLNSPDVETLGLICKILGKDGNYFFDTFSDKNSVEKCNFQIKSNYGTNSLLVLENYARLNNIGQEKVHDYISDLIEINKYLK